jgi:hypothetical protein
MTPLSLVMSAMITFAPFTLILFCEAMPTLGPSNNGACLPPLSVNKLHTDDQLAWNILPSNIGQLGKKYGLGLFAGTVELRIESTDHVC